MNVKAHEKERSGAMKHEPKSAEMDTVDMLIDFGKLEVQMENLPNRKCRSRCDASTGTFLVSVILPLSFKSSLVF